MKYLAIIRSALLLLLVIVDLIGYILDINNMYLLITSLAFLIVFIITLPNTLKCIESIKYKRNEEKSNEIHNSSKGKR